VKLRFNLAFLNINMILEVPSSQNDHHHISQATNCYVEIILSDDLHVIGFFGDSSRMI
jgi:hypothetical protein